MKVLTSEDGQIELDFHFVHRPSQSEEYDDSQINRRYPIIHESHINLH